MDQGYFPMRICRDSLCNLGGIRLFWMRTGKDSIQYLGKMVVAANRTIREAERWGWNDDFFGSQDT